ncbi:MAG: arylesterase [Sphingopyxis sp.]|nr:arylesterase [Sphingopyxis sp.]
MAKQTRTRPWLRYGAAALLCQALVACGSAEAPPESTKERASTAAVAPVPADAPLVIAFGDSLYAGYQLGPTEGLAPQLQSALVAAGRPARVQNAGVSGDTTAAGRARLSFVLDNAPTKPALVVLGLGGNDMLRGIGAAETRANLTAMMEELKRRDIPVVLTGMLAAPNLGADYGRAFNGIFPDLAKRYDAGLYPFVLEGVLGQPQLMLPDGIHPTADGVTVMAKGIAPLVAGKLPKQF